MATKSEIEAPDPRIYGFNPISHHFVKKSGAVWLRLVKAGMAEDPELIRGLQDKAIARKKVAESAKRSKKRRPLPPKRHHPSPRSSARYASMSRVTVRNSMALRAMLWSSRYAN